MSLRLFIGTDEAGYGPNLGPLVIAATAWQASEVTDCSELWQALHRIVAPEKRPNDRRLFVADSKTVYASGDSLEALEVPVLSFLSTTGIAAGTLDELAGAVSNPGFRSAWDAEPWNQSPGLAIPADSSDEHITEWIDLLGPAMHVAGVRLCQIAVRIIFPAEFNQLVELAGSKGAVLSDATLQLVRQLTDLHASGTVQVVCDKHGGRNRYDELIASHFDDQFVFRVEESRERSRYRLGTIDFCFRTRAEELLPVALASMTAKYLRETLMRQFNTWWQQQLPGLRPTQGYPVDAKRFLADIQHLLQPLQISESLLWRTR
ncbi:MAG: hypothetical protein ACK6D4_05060 [Planctomyces sp.]